MNLSNLRILNTRPLGQNKKLSRAIQQAQGIVVELPTIQIEATPSIWVQNLSNLNAFNHTIFTSVNAVKYFFKGLQAHNIVWNHHIKVAAIGKMTAQSLQQFHIYSTTPIISDSEHLLELPFFTNLKNTLLVKGKGGRTLIEDTLRQKNELNETIRILNFLVMSNENS